MSYFDELAKILLASTAHDMRWINLCKAVGVNPDSALSDDWEKAVNRVISLHLQEGAERLMEHIRAGCLAYRAEHLSSTEP